MNVLHPSKVSVEAMFGLMKLPVRRLPVDLTDTEWGQIEDNFTHVYSLALSTQQHFSETAILSKAKKDAVGDCFVELGIGFMDFDNIEKSIYALLSHRGSLDYITLHEVIPQAEILKGFHAMPNRFNTAFDEACWRDTLPRNINLGEFKCLVQQQSSHDEIPDIRGFYPSEALIEQVKSAEAKLREVMPY